MNLDDYAYNQDDRWYVNPQVALDEQNAFINNLRNLQAQDNAQITQQTRNLGTQVPSQLGGLVGGGGYFRSRYQTPQTNQTIANLRTAAQAQALQTLLANEIEKAKKKYKDAQNSATSGNVDPWSIINAGNEGKKYKTEYAGTVEDEIVTDSTGKDISKTVQQGEDELDEDYIARIGRLYANGEISEEDFQNAYHWYMMNTNPAITTTPTNLGYF